MSDLVGNPEDRFSHNEAHVMMYYEPRYKKTCLRLEISDLGSRGTVLSMKQTKAQISCAVNM